MNRYFLRAAATLLVLLFVLQAGAGAQEGATALYACSGEHRAEATVVGLTLCDSEPTPDLLAQAQAENLQVREGALVTAAAAGGVAAVAGLQAGDLIYRVGGADVAGAGTAAGRLAQVAARADTVVNFLRGGRPYRIKLRRE
jgi:membrane-associated protease RseP (regulator of RpoE activity)